MIMKQSVVAAVLCLLFMVAACGESNFSGQTGRQSADADKNGKIVGDCTYPNQLTDDTPIDERSAEWLEYLNRKPEKKLSIDGLLTEAEKLKLIDYCVTNKIITPERASEIKGAK